MFVPLEPLTQIFFSFVSHFNDTYGYIRIFDFTLQHVLLTKKIIQNLHYSTCSKFMQLLFLTFLKYAYSNKGRVNRVQERTETTNNTCIFTCFVSVKPCFNSLVLNNWNALDTFFLQSQCKNSCKTVSSEVILLLLIVKKQSWFTIFFCQHEGSLWSAVDIHNSQRLFSNDTLFLWPLSLPPVHNFLFPSPEKS